MNRSLYLYSIFFWLFSFFNLHAENSAERNEGTLVVTYQSNQTERLDRIRFWLIDERQERSLYPKNGESVDSHSGLERIVVISHLIPGKYSLQFLVPNTDGIFEPVPHRQFDVRAGDVIHIDQEIKIKEPKIAINPLSQGALGLITINRYPFYPPLYPPFSPFIGPPPLPAGAGLVNFSMKSNIAVDWRVMQGDTIILSGRGNVSKAYIPSGPDYRIAVPYIPGFIARIYPQGIFNAEVTTPINAEIYYQKKQIQVPLTDPIPTPQQQVLPPEPQPVVEKTDEGKVILSSNVNAFSVSIKPLESRQSPFQQDVTNRSETIQLPKGRYQITYLPLNTGEVAPSAIEINVKPYATQNVYLAYTIAQKPKTTPTLPKTSGILVVTNLTNSTFTIEEVKESGANLIGKYKGKSNFIPLPNAGTFKISFDLIPNFQVPAPVTIDHKANERTTVEALYQQGDSLAEVPAGDAIVGDPFNDNQQNERPAKVVSIPRFAIGVYEVTNQQFAEWLNSAIKAGTIQKHKMLEGHFVNSEGFLICRTLEGDPLAQILTQGDHDTLMFSPIAGRENYPVIQVSWYGAHAYCQDHHYRLPSESEWEKAAGTKMQNGVLKRFKYGFSSDVVDRKWANYKDPLLDINAKQVRTTPVGFYNGINTLPLTLSDQSQLRTNNAVSPVGAYDMSGNVWEWVDSWDELDPNQKNKIAKGGCYDSLAEGIRVSERLPAPPDYADVFTGFRVAKSLPPLEPPVTPGVSKN